jgi:hypothetical protein
VPALVDHYFPFSPIMPADVSPPRPEMVAAVDAALKNLEQIAPDPGIIGACPELPGIVLDKVMGTVRSHKDPAYLETTRNYNLLRSDYLKALVAHPVGRALALLAVGPQGVELMEAGRVPSSVQAIAAPSNFSPRTRRQQYNCHHIIPKSLAIDGGMSAVNNPGNFVITKTTRRGRDQSQNPHHCWHALLLHPQMQNAPDHPVPVYVVRPLFPFYPPVTQGFRTVEELRNRLQALGSPPLPEVWEKRVLEFSRVARHKPYEVPKEFQEITRLYGEFFQKKNKDPVVQEAARKALAERAANQAAQWLPAGAYVNGQQLPPDHLPKKVLPILASQVAITEPSLQQTGQKKRAKQTKKINITNQPSICP